MGYLSIDFGSRLIRLLETEGTAKRLKLKAFRMIDTSREGSDMLEDSGGAKQAADAVKRTLSKHKFSRDPSSMALDSSQCIIRDLSLPFKSDDQIRKVIKFETESHIQHDIDEVVVSYFKKTETIDKSNLMVLAAKKSVLRKHLDFLDGLNIDPFYVDLDILCLYNALTGTGIAKEHRCFVALNLARDHTDFLVVAKERLVSCRSIPLAVGGIAAALQHDLSQEKLDPSDSGVRLLGFMDDRALMIAAFDEQSAGPKPEDAGAEAEEAAETAEKEKSGAKKDAAKGEPAGSAGKGAAKSLPAPDGAAVPAGTGGAAQVDSISHKWRQDFLQKLRREVLRVLSVIEMEEAPEKVYLTGVGSSMPGVAEALQSLFHAEAAELDFLSHVEHSFPEADIRAINHEVGVALGVAYKQVGHDATRVNMRQEDVKYAKKFDQIKVPLTCLTFLLLIMIVLLNLKLLKERQCQQQELEWMFRLAERELAAAVESLDKARDRLGSKEPNSKEGIVEIDRQLKEENTRLLDELGRGGTIPELPSVFPVWTGFFDALAANEENLELFKLDSIKIVTMPTPLLTIDGEVATGADLSQLMTILNGIPLISKVEAGDSTPAASGNRKFTNMRATIDYQQNREAE